jgi:hypothetical protein
MRVSARSPRGRGKTKGSEMVVTPDTYKRTIASAPRERYRVPIVHCGSGRASLIPTQASSRSTLP